MNTEEKAKAYDEALERAKDCLTDRKFSETEDTIRSVMEYIFPELEESENERIKEAIESIIRVYGKTRGEWIAGYDMDTLVVHLRDAFTYLEKQKEQKQVESDGPHYTKRNALFDKCVENCDPVVMKKVSDEVDEMLQKERKPLTIEETELNSIAFLEQMGYTCIPPGKEQKPVPINPDDMHMLERIIELVEFCNDKETIWNWLCEKVKEQKPFNVYEQYPYYKDCPNYNEQKPADSVSEEEYVKKFKALCDAYEIKLPNREYDIYHLCHDLSKLSIDSGKQKPAEWGEEDEKRVKQLIYDTEHIRAEYEKRKKELGESFNDKLIKDCDEQIDWLKSLPERFNLQSNNEWNEEDRKMYKMLSSMIHGTFVVETQETQDKLLSWLKSLLERVNLQSKEEWSEEDEMKREGVIQWLREYQKKFNPKDDSLSIDSIDSLIDWFKSLRSSWKPSEDEERLINTSISFLKDFADKGYENAVECIDWLKSKLNGNSCK